MQYQKLRIFLLNIFLKCTGKNEVSGRYTDLLVLTSLVIFHQEPICSYFYQLEVIANKDYSQSVNHKLHLAGRSHGMQQF